MTHASEYRSIVGRVGGWWKKWRERNTALAELAQCGGAEMEHIARDTGLSIGDLRVLAGRWPDSADLLSRRLAALGQDAADITRGQPQVMRDLQRVCSICANKRVCEHDLDRSPGAVAWVDYCPNAETLDAICSQSSTQPTRRAS
jgi:hypothetical protein